MQKYFITFKHPQIWIHSHTHTKTHLTYPSNTDTHPNINNTNYANMINNYKPLFEAARFFYKFMDNREYEIIKMDRVESVSN